jgi:prepilin-type N-terminal cleavage/methylation domain-containing protein
MKNNQKGFSVVEILIVIVIVGLIGVAGWFVYNRQNDKQAPATQITRHVQNQEQTEDVSAADVPEIVGSTKNVNHFDQSYSFTLPEKWSFVEEKDDSWGEYYVTITDPASTYRLRLSIQETDSTSSKDTGNSSQEKSLVFTGVNGKKNYVINTAITEPSLPPQLFISTCKIGFCHSIVEKDKYILNTHVARFDFDTTVSMPKYNKTPISLEDEIIKQILAIIGTIKFQEK